MPIGKGKIRIAVMAMAMALLASCHEPQQNPQPASESTTKEPSDMRTVIPLVRRLEPTDTGLIELEFDVPALPDDDTPPVFIGVRLGGNDRTAVGDAADTLRAADITVEVRLYRLQQSGQIAVELKRSQRVGRGESQQVVLSAEGAVLELSSGDADITSLREAGLLSPGTVYRELEFAGTPNLPVGRYRAVIRLGENRQALFDANAELIIAYRRKGK